MKHLPKGASPQFRKRSALLKLCAEKGLSRQELLNLFEPMRSKTSEEKEKIAVRLLTELTGESPLVFS